MYVTGGFDTAIGIVDACIKTLLEERDLGVGLLAVNQDVIS